MISIDEERERNSANDTAVQLAVTLTRADIAVSLQELSWSLSFLIIVYHSVKESNKTNPRSANTLRNALSANCPQGLNLRNRTAGRFLSDKINPAFAYTRAVNNLRNVAIIQDRYTPEVGTFGVSSEPRGLRPCVQWGYPLLAS
jgi:hypothetical protein